MNSTNNWLAKSTLTPFPYPMTPMNNTTPLTMREGITFQGTLERLRDWIENGIVPGFESIMALAFQDYLDGLRNAENTVVETKEQWQLLFDNFMAGLEGEVKSLNDEAISQLFGEPESSTHKAAMALINAVNAALEDALKLEFNSDIEGVVELISSLDSAYKEADNKKVNVSEKGQPNGIPTLGADGKIPSNQLKSATMAGFYKARPNANSVPAGTLYNAIDVNETYRSNGATWDIWAWGGELFYVGLHKDVDMFSTESQTYVDIPGLKMNVTAGERPFKVIFDFACAVNVMDWATYALFIDGTEVREFLCRIEKTETWETFNGEYTVRNLTPGVSYDVALKVKATNGTVRTAGAPYIQAVTV